MELIAGILIGICASIFYDLFLKKRVRYCPRCSGLGWVNECEHTDYGNGIGMTSITCVRCPRCKGTSKEAYRPLFDKREKYHEVNSIYTRQRISHS